MDTVIFMKFMLLIFVGLMIWQVLDVKNINKDGQVMIGTILLSKDNKYIDKDGKLPKRPVYDKDMSKALSSKYKWVRNMLLVNRSNATFNSSNVFG